MNFPTTQKGHKGWNILVCSSCGSSLKRATGSLWCSHGHRFGVRDGIPIFFEVKDNHHRHQEHYFEKFYAQYDRLPQLNWHKRYWNLLIDDHSPKKDKLLVDLATGTGWLAIAAAKAGLWVIATELTHEIARRAQQFAEHEGVAKRMLFVVADAEHLPFANNRVDYLTAVALLEHLPHEKQAAQEFARILRRGGKLWLVTPNDLRFQPLIFKAILFFYDRVLGHFHHFSRQDLQKIFGNVGLKETSYHYVGHLIKLWQLMIHAIVRNDRLWWILETIDERQQQLPSSINIIATFKK